VARYPNSRLQLSGHRFLLRRLERAVLLGDAAADDEHVRRQPLSVAVGALVAVLALAGCALLGWLRPPAGLGDGLILLDRVTGALYVRVDDKVHPVLNLASARLITGVSDDPRPVAATDLANAKRGPLLGIPGAPGFIGPALTAGESAWTVCDGSVTTVIAGPMAPDGGVRGLASDEAVLVSSVSGTTYLLYDGRRAVVDPTDPVTVRALHLEGRTPRPASPALLSLIPEAPAITAPAIRDAGRPGPQALSGFMIGDVVRVERADGTDYFVVLAGGVQRIGAVAADLIQFASARPDTDITAVAPTAISDVPILGVLPVAEFPDRIGPPLTGDLTVLCASWAAGKVVVRPGAGSPTGEGHAPVELAQADGGGPAVDAVSMPPGRSAYVGAKNTDATGSLVTDTGVRYPLGDGDTAHLLGLPDDPVPAPWQLVAMLPSGPELSKATALVARDVVTAEPPRARR
jgi:type VII secretion protein EccB